MKGFFGICFLSWTVMSVLHHFVGADFANGVGVGFIAAALLAMWEAGAKKGRDRDGHRMAETVSGSVHDQPGPKGSPNGGTPPHSAE